jgi:hypothetical protein
MSEIIKCSECGELMAIKDSNTYDDEYWEGYECINCGNVELLVMDAELKTEKCIFESTHKVLGEDISTTPYMHIVIK